MRISWALMLITCVVCCIFLTACETQSTTDSQQMGTESAPQSESAEISEEDEQQIQKEAELPKKEEQVSETEEALLSEDKDAENRNWTGNLYRDTGKQFVGGCTEGTVKRWTAYS